MPIKINPATNVGVLLDDKLKGTAGTSILTPAGTGNSTGIVGKPIGGGTTLKITGGTPVIPTQPANTGDTGTANTGVLEPADTGTDTPTATGTGTTTTTNGGNTPLPATPFYKKQWFVMAAIVLCVAVAGGAVYFMVKKR